MRSADVPFVAYRDEIRVCALDYRHPSGDTVTWTEFRADRALTGSLRLPCCGAGVVCKTSVRGLPFFAHRVVGSCDFPGESPRHQLLKMEVRNFIRTLPGWTADVEVRSPTRDWIADVLATHASGIRMAFEIQLSGQKLENYVARTIRYRDAGIHTVWLVTGSAPPMRAHHLAHLILAAPADGQDELDAGGMSYQQANPREGTLRRYLAFMANPELEWDWDGRDPEPLGLVPVTAQYAHMERDLRRKDRGRSGRAARKPAGHSQPSHLPAPVVDDRQADDPQRLQDLYLRLTEAAERGHW